MSAPQQRDAGGDRGPAGPAGKIAEGAVAAEQLVAPEPRDGNLQPELLGRLGHEPRVDAVDRGLVHRLEDARQVGSELALRDPSRRVPRAEGARDLRGERRLVLVGGSQFVEGKRHGLDVAVAGIAHQADERARVDAGGQERADGHVRHEVVAHAVEKRRTHLTQGHRADRGGR